MFAIATGVALLFITAAVIWVRRFDNVADQAAFDHAAATDAWPFQAQRMVYAAARPLANTPVLRRQLGLRFWAPVRTKLQASGMFGSDLQVFLAVQAFTVLASMIVLVLLIGSDLRGAEAFGGALFAAGIAFYPYSQVLSKSKKRGEAVTRELPEFAELLVMLLQAGESVQSALQLAASSMSGGVIRGEIQALTTILAARSLTEREAFDLTAERLGTDEARQFFNTLTEAAVAGARVTPDLQRQADNMRAIYFQQRRALAKKLPVTLVIALGIHFMPALFAVTLLPVFVTLGGAF
jgi:pilus assembly protein TadC